MTDRYAGMAHGLLRGHSQKAVLSMIGRHIAVLSRSSAAPLWRLELTKFAFGELYRFSDHVVHGISMAVAIAKAGHPTIKLDDIQIRLFCDRKASDFVAGVACATENALASEAFSEVPESPMDEDRLVAVITSIPRFIERATTAATDPADAGRAHDQFVDRTSHRLRVTGMGITACERRWIHDDVADQHAPGIRPGVAAEQCSVDLGSEIYRDAVCSSPQRSEYIFGADSTAVTVAEASGQHSLA